METRRPLRRRCQTRQTLLAALLGLQCASSGFLPLFAHVQVYIEERHRVPVRAAPAGHKTQTLTRVSGVQGMSTPLSSKVRKVRPLERNGSSSSSGMDAEDGSPRRVRSNPDSGSDGKEPDAVDQDRSDLERDMSVCSESSTGTRVVQCQSVIAAVPFATRAPLVMATVPDATLSSALHRMLDAVRLAGRPSSSSTGVQAATTAYHSWEFDAHLLVQSGPRVSPAVKGLWINSPPCMWGSKCIGMDMHARIQGFPPDFPGVVFMCTMTFIELDAHHKTGALPDKKELTRPCLLCWWRALTRIDINLMCEDPFVMPRGILSCPYRNKIEPGQYLADACIQPSTTTGLKFPVAALLFDRLLAVQDAHGVWWIDHRSMRWPLDPSPSGTSQDAKGFPFSKRASQ